MKPVGALLAISYLWSSHAVLAQNNTRAAMRTYCVPCHNARLAEANIALDTLDPQRAWAEAEIWERVLRQLRARTMPPTDNPRPDAKTYEASIAELAATLDRGDPQKPAAAPRRTADLAVAARLAKLLWNGAPDAELLAAARKGRLHDTAVLESEVRRMLADAKIAGLAGGFFDDWLGTNQVATMPADSAAFSEFDSSLRQALQRETEMFLESQLREDRPAMELWTANYTYVNERLARHYGIRGVSGPEFRRVTLDGTERAGLLGEEFSYRHLRVDAARCSGRAFDLTGGSGEMDTDAFSGRVCAASDPWNTTAAKGRPAERTTADAAGSFL